MRRDSETGGESDSHDRLGGSATAEPGAIADAARLKIVAELGFAGHDGDPVLDGVLRTLAAACDIEVAAVNIITPGRQVFAAEMGIGAPCDFLPDELSFCATVVRTTRPLVVADAARHPVLRDCPAVTSGLVGAYAGEPLVHRGVIVGALGIFPGRARQFTDTHLSVLYEQARLVENLLEMRYSADHTNAVMLRSLIDHSESIIHVKDLEGRYLLANPPLEALFGITESDLLGKTDDYYHPELAAVWQANDARARSGGFHIEEFIDLPDGTHIFESVKYPLVDSSGTVYATGGVSLDVTAKRRAAQEVADARDAAVEASRQKSTFLATMSHEIRTPMNAVIGMTGLLLDTPLDADQREFVETVRSSGEALLSIINDILDFSKIEAGGLRLENRPFELRACVEGALELVAATTGAEVLELVVHVDDRCPDVVLGDPTRLAQVLVNLLRNAVKFTPVGEVLLAVEPVSGESGLRFSVTDTGIGIPPDRLASLFDSFSQVDASTTRLYGGTGLGLAISRRLVEAMGGALTVDSVSGAGSTFGFAVVLGPVPDATGLTARRHPEELRGRSVLLVDDNRTSRRVLRHLLASWGMQVVAVADGSAALASLRSGARFDVALLDRQLPGMSGRELARRLGDLAAVPPIPLVLLGSPTGSREDQPVMFAAVVPKPVRSGRLQDAVRTVLSPGEVVPVPVPVPSPAASGSAAGPLLILLAEDNPVNQRLGRLMLEKLGHRVDVVANGRAAADAVRQLHYDAVLMDVEMPVLDGLEATRRIRGELPAARQPQIVALTASALVEDREACLAAGMDDHLAKPVRLSDLEATLRRVVARVERPAAGVDVAVRSVGTGDQRRRGAALQQLLRDVEDLARLLRDVVAGPAEPDGDDLDAILETECRGVRQELASAVQRLTPVARRAVARVTADGGRSGNPRSAQRVSAPAADGSGS